MANGGQQYPSLSELANRDPQAYRDMTVNQRVGMLQGPYFNDRESMSPADLELFKLLNARKRREDALSAADGAQNLSGDQNSGFLSQIFQLFSGRQPVDPLEALKQPGYSGQPSR